MVDVLRFESPVTTIYPTGETEDLTLGDLSEITKQIVRADSKTAAAEQLAVTFGSSRIDGDVIVLGQRPDEFLLVGTPTATASLVEGLDRSGHVSVIDHTHSRAMFRLTGSNASATLEKLCSVDWSEPMTPNGAVVSASLAKVGCDIARLDRGPDRSYLIACDRSFAQYLFDAIIDAGNEFDIAVVALAPTLV
ncbi:MAG: hypothetical protein HKN03_02110 [Acidimicrobiales bacterium]|nr:hypothetical protein [Acidimicrobiales bacterium]